MTADCTIRRPSALDATATRGPASKPDAIDDARRLTEAEFGADAAFHLVIATAWAPDPHLVRDVAICSTAEI